MEKKHIFPIDLSFSSFQGEKRPRVTGHGSCLVPRNRHWPGDRRSFAARRPTESAREEVPTGHGAPRIGRAPKSGHPNFPQPQNSGFLSSLCHQASESWKETDSRRHAKTANALQKNWLSRSDQCSVLAIPGDFPQSFGAFVWPRDLKAFFRTLCFSGRVRQTLSRRVLHGVCAD